MNLKQRIKQAQETRAAKMAELEKLVEKTGGDSPRAFTDEEQTAFNTLSGEVKSLDTQIEQFVQTEQLAAKSAVVISEAPTRTPDITVPKPNSNLPKGIAAAREVIAIIRANGDPFRAATIAKGLWGDSTPEVWKKFEMKAAVAAGTTTAAAWAGNTIIPDTISEIVELLRAETLIGKMEAKMRKVPFNIRFLTETAGVSAQWVGQGLSKPVGAPGFGTGTFPFAKVAVIVVFTDELLRFSNLAIETMVRDSIVRGTSEYLDNQFIDSAVAPVANVSPGSITNAIVPIASASADATPTVAEATSDLSRPLLAMTAGNLSPRAPFWIMNPRTIAALSFLRTTQETFAFRDELNSGKLLGIPVISSSAVNINLAPGTASEITLVDAAEIFYADDGNMEFDMSKEASLQMDDAPATPPTPLVSLWQQNMTAIKGERFIYWQRRRALGVQVVNAVLY